MSKQEKPVKQAENITGAEDVDQESVNMSNNPKFLAILSQARAQKGKGGFSCSGIRRDRETEKLS